MFLEVVFKTGKSLCWSDGLQGLFATIGPATEKAQSPNLVCICRTMYCSAELMKHYYSASMTDLAVRTPARTQMYILTALQSYSCTCRIVFRFSYFIYQASYYCCIFRLNVTHLESSYVIFTWHLLRPWSFVNSWMMMIMTYTAHLHSLVLQIVVTFVGLISLLTAIVNNMRTEVILGGVDLVLCFVAECDCLLLTRSYFAI